MSKKFFFISVAAVLAAVALAGIPTMASANKIGTCVSKVAPETKPPCAAKVKFTPYAEGTPVAVLEKKAGGTTALFELQNEATPANGFTCSALSGQGNLINLGGVGQAVPGQPQALVFEKCKGTGALASCTKPNGTEKLIGEVTNEINSKGETEVTVKSGFVIYCSGIGDLGGVTGKVVGQEVSGKGYETAYTKAKGLTFAAEPSTQSGISEVVEAFAPKDKVYAEP